MPTVINAQYLSPSERIETEEQLVELLNDLKKVYGEFKGFRITDNKKREVTDLKSFLETLFKDQGILTLQGSGNLGGISIDSGIVRYDFSQVYNKAGRWNDRINGTCYGCSNIIRHFLAQDDSVLICGLKNYSDKEVLGLPKELTCEKYDPRAKNKDGKKARPLEVLIDEVSTKNTLSLTQH